MMRPVISSARSLSRSVARQATRAFSTQQQQQQSRGQSSSSSSSSSSSKSRWAGVFGATLLFGATTTVALAADDQKVDYNAVRSAIANKLEKEGYDDGSYGPVLVRLAWHCAGTFDVKTGKWGSNAGLDVARDLLEPIKKAFPTISYADLYTLAGVVAIEEMGGPTIPWRPGRTDATDGTACPPDGNLPDASKEQNHLRNIFYRMGFDDRAIVALSGAHALGRCHTNRSGYDQPWTRAPTTFSNEYFRLLLEETWTPRKWKGPLQYTNSKSGSDLMMLPTDLSLIQDPAFKTWVDKYAKDQELFFNDFAKYFSQLLELGVKFPEPQKPKSLWNKLFG